MDVDDMSMTIPRGCMGLGWVRQLFRSRAGNVTAADVRHVYGNGRRRKGGPVAITAAGSERVLIGTPGAFTDS